MIEFVQSAAPWLGLALMLLGGVAFIAGVALLVLELIWRAIKNWYSFPVVWAALRAWHKAHPEKSSGEAQP